LAFVISKTEHFYSWRVMWKCSLSEYNNTCWWQRVSLSIRDERVYQSESEQKAAHH